MGCVCVGGGIPFPRVRICIFTLFSESPWAGAQHCPQPPPLPVEPPRGEAPCLSASRGAGRTAPPRSRLGPRSFARGGAGAGHDRATAQWRAVAARWPRGGRAGCVGRGQGPGGGEAGGGGRGAPGGDGNPRDRELSRGARGRGARGAEEPRGSSGSAAPIPSHRRRDDPSERRPRGRRRGRAARRGGEHRAAALSCIYQQPGIQGANAKHGLRCKACKMSIHHKCTDGLAPQRCMGKLPKGFRRYYSSPLLIHEQFGCIKEVMPIACGNKVDPVYETLRFGTSLAQRTKKGSSGSGSDSPHRTSTSDLVEVPEESDGSGGYDLRKRSNSVFTYPENGTEDFRDQAKNVNHQESLPKDPLQMNTYVALYKFVPQENEDLEMRPGDMITLLEDSNEDWWKGKIQDRIGFFPANFVQRVQENEKIFRCVRTFVGCKEQGQITLKENQICVTSEEERDGFIRVFSGKKRGLVPFDVLENV
ncbi:SH3 and cysteine-rich domain-containing protein isoform X1 [Erinaceus europaeus]|uniref:SH3 and cysteine-rich domain-containing protein isoform X1 n=1 Tax=Erinaceus europaeus TaxID=9365 RepID=A0ABM3WIZ6_ERIEU|nr:SH3 and cysteine-rich domain-containing protein isoform X1 [Erinaceus europaeus]